MFSPAVPEYARSPLRQNGKFLEKVHSCKAATLTLSHGSPKRTVRKGLDLWQQPPLPEPGPSHSSPDSRALRRIDRGRIRRVPHAVKGRCGRARRDLHVSAGACGSVAQQLVVGRCIQAVLVGNAPASMSPSAPLRPPVPESLQICSGGAYLSARITPSPASQHRRVGRRGESVPGADNGWRRQGRSAARGAQVDQVTDADEDRIDAVLRAQHLAALGASQGWQAADHLAVVAQRSDRAASRSRLTMRPDEPALSRLLRCQLSGCWPLSGDGGRAR